MLRWGWLAALLVFGASAQEVDMKGRFNVSGIYIAHSHANGSYAECSSEIFTVYALVSEAQRWALREANRGVFGVPDSSLVLGTRMLDSCANGAVGLQKSAVIFCNRKPICKARAAGTRHEDLGTLFANGYISSEVAKNMDLIFQAFCLPVVCSGCSSAEFENNHMYKYLLRIYPSDSFQARAVAAIVQRLQWSPVYVLYDSSIYGTSLYDKFLDIAQNETAPHELCIEESIALPQSQPQDIKAEVAKFAEKLVERRDTNSAPVVILFVQISTGKDVLSVLSKYIARHNLTLQIVATDSISTVAFGDELEPALKYTVTTEADVELFPAFQEYLGNMTYSDVRQNAWLVQLLEQHYRCSFYGGSSERRCDGSNETIDGVLDSSFMGGVTRRARLVYRSVLVAALALNETLHRYCGDIEDWRRGCPAFARNITGQELYDVMKGVSYEDHLDSFHFFNGTNAGPPLFAVFQYLVRNGSGSPWHQIGTYDGTSQSLSHLSLTGAPWSSQIAARRKDCFFSSKCEQAGKTRAVRRRFQTGDKGQATCCWACEECPTASHRLRSRNQETDCVRCNNSGEVGDKATNFTTCMSLTVMKEASVPLLVFLGLAALLGLLSLLSTGVLLYNWTTPLARAFQRDLTLAQNVCVGLLTMTTALSVPNAHQWTCGGAWAAASSLLCLSHGLTLAKALRSRRPSWYLRLCRGDEGWLSGHLPRALLASVAAAQAALVALWWITTQPRLHPDTIRFDDWYLTCTANEETLSLFLLLLPAALVILPLPLLKASLYGHFHFQVKQAQWSVVGQVALLVPENTKAYVLSRHVRSSSVGTAATGIFRVEPVIASVSEIFTAQPSSP